VQFNEERPLRTTGERRLGRAGWRDARLRQIAKQLVAEVVDDALHPCGFAGAAMARDEKGAPSDFLAHVAAHLSQKNSVGVGGHERWPAWPRPIAVPLWGSDGLI
jgi:hypothetical protein